MRRNSQNIRNSAPTGARSEALASRRLQEVSFGAKKKKDESLFLRRLLMKNLFCLRRERKRENVRSLFLHICIILYLNAYIYYCISAIKRKVMSLLKLGKNYDFHSVVCHIHDLYPTYNYLSISWYLPNNENAILC